MNYTSTRRIQADHVSAAEAIKRGLAPDGGLYMPTRLPSLSPAELQGLLDKSYAARAAYILGLFLTDYTSEELLTDCSAAYSEEKFPGGAAPLHKVDDSLYSLELWHGPTSAFKDMALQIMPRLLSRALTKTGEERTALILVATSGDTGKAALEGYKDIDGIRIQVFYPVDGVSRVQKLQMMTQTGDNVCVRAIRGNFDDAQNGVKRIFGDKEMAEELNKEGFFLSSANSINWGRLAPQIVYYVSAYCDMVKAGTITLGEEIDVCVPTGNFGNIFAAYIAKCMGLPLRRLICASNTNNILTDFLETGVYDRNRAFHTTMSPSMDILISSNLERLLYLTCGAEKTAGYMKELSQTGRYAITEGELSSIRENFVGYCTNEDQCAKILKETYEKCGYLCDTHTAVGVGAVRQYQAQYGKDKKVLLASTASPYKFAFDVYRSIAGECAEDELRALEQLNAKTGVAIPAPLCGIGERTIRFDGVGEPEAMKDEVLAFAKA